MRMLVGYVPTKAGIEALAVAIERAATQGSSLAIVNIVRQDRLGDVRHADENQLREAEKKAQDAGIKEVTAYSIEAVDGEDLVPVLLSEVARQNVNLLVIGVRDNAQIPAHLLGSTIQEIVADAPCNVLVV